MTHTTQVVVIGGGQAGVAAGYHLRRLGLDFVVLDAQAEPGGAWRHAWDSLHLFSPAAFSSLPGRPMPVQVGESYPDAGHVVGYLAEYERRYELPVHRPVRVTNEYEGGFRIGAATQTLDSVEECDGAAVLNAPLGARYPRGLLVVQDGQETPAVPDGEGGTRTATGFKFVDLGAVVDAVGV